MKTYQQLSRLLGACALIVAGGVLPVASAADSSDSTASTSTSRADERARDRPGPGMMGGYQGGMGPGMMGGYQGGMGPGMMGGYQGRMGPGMMMGGMGPGMMMGGMGPGMMMGGMGPGMMMGGHCGGLLYAIDLTSDQLSKIDKICDDLRKRHWELAGKMMEEQARLRDLNNAEKRDAAAIVKQFANIQALQRQMLEQSLEVENRIEGVLTKEQLAQYRNMRRRGGY